MQTVYLVPLTVVFLGLAIAALGIRARRRRGYGPLAVGSTAAVLLVVGKFIVTSDLAVWAGVAALIGASLWNAWPARSTTSAATAPAGALYQIGSIIKEKQ
jgi:hypothetical protein